MSITVSVVVPTYKRTGLLQRCLDALLRQTLDRSLYEIVIVDDAGTEETRKLVDEIRRRSAGPYIRYLRTGQMHGPAAARNCGWKAAAGGIIAFTDDDCVPEPGWLAAGVSAFTGDVAGVSGRIIVPVSRNPTDYEKNTSLLAMSEFVTANCFYLKAVLEETGGFDERFTRAWREDADLFFTLLTRRKRLIKAPNAVVVHPVRAGRWGISIAEQSKSMFNALLYKKHPELYKQKIHNPLLANYYTVVTSCILFFTCAAAGMRNLAVIFFCVWLGSTFRIAIKRLRGTTYSLKHVLEMITTSFAIPFLSVYWRLAGAIRFNVFFY